MRNVKSQISNFLKILYHVFSLRLIVISDVLDDQLRIIIGFQVLHPKLFVHSESYDQGFILGLIVYQKELKA